MTSLPALPIHDLISLLNSRLCHDIISPIGSIYNALEFLEEDANDLEALKLIRMATVSASSKIQYMRLAYGAGNSLQEEIPLGSIKKIVEDYMVSDRLKILWPENEVSFTKRQIKFLLNLLFIAHESIPRGGEIHIFEKKEDGSFFIKVTGKILKLSPKFAALQNGELKEDEIDPYTIQAYYTLMLAEDLNLKIDVREKENSLIFTTISI